MKYFNPKKLSLIVLSINNSDCSINALVTIDELRLLWSRLISDVYLLILILSSKDLIVIVFTTGSWWLVILMTQFLNKYIYAFVG